MNKAQIKVEKTLLGLINEVWKTIHLKETLYGNSRLYDDFEAQDRLDAELTALYAQLEELEHDLTVAKGLTV